jgi:hypothetical protein
MLGCFLSEVRANLNAGSSWQQMGVPLHSGLAHRHRRQVKLVKQSPVKLVKLVKQSPVKLVKLVKQSPAASVSAVCFVSSLARRHRRQVKFY